jgi:hypothetical protein
MPAGRYAVETDRPLSEEAIGYTLERYDSQAVFRLGCEVARQSKRNGVFRSNWPRGLVVAVDGIEICSSYVRFCAHCLERKVTHLVEGEPREEIQYYHRICAVSVVSSAFPIPLGIRFQKSGENEVACSLEPLRALTEALGKRFVDVPVADALYLQGPFVKAIQGLGLDWVINLKENQPELLTESEAGDLHRRRRENGRKPGVAALARAGGLLAGSRAHRLGWSKPYASSR